MSGDQAPVGTARATLALLGATAIWGGTFVTVKDALSASDTFTFLALRFAVGEGARQVDLERRRRAQAQRRRGSEAGIPTDSSRTIELRVRNTFIPRLPARNVFGVVEAKGGSKDWIIVSAHYDQLGHMAPDVLYPGANNNASGMSMLLCLAEEIKQHPLKKNVLFIAFAGEEAGLQGSRWCVTDRPIDFSHISMMVNLDLNGTGEEGITVVNSTAQQKFFDKLTEINRKDNLLVNVKPRGPACNSDHCPFVQRGIPGIFIYTLGGVAHYHDVRDRSETPPLSEFADLHALLRDFIIALK